MMNLDMGKHYFAIQIVGIIVYSSVILFTILYSSCIILCILKFLWIQYLEYYWNNVIEEEFFDKLHNIILEVNPNILVFGSARRSFIYSIKRIYDNMNEREKLEFIRLINNNGLDKRLRKYFRLI